MKLHPSLPLWVAVATTLLALVSTGPTHAASSAGTAATSSAVGTTGASSTSGTASTTSATAAAAAAALSASGLSASALAHLPIPGLTTTETPPQPPVIAPGLTPEAADAADTPLVFGSQMFNGRFGYQSFSGFNPDYQISVGDRISIRLWGAYHQEGTLVVDTKGNVFLPNIGPVRLQGLRNGDLNTEIQQHIKRIYRANVQSYATLDSAQPVKVYVTGFVKQPGLYNGVSSDSVLYFLDQAGGIDANRGSYLDVEVLRSNQERVRFNLYRFLLEGRIQSLQFHDGDTVIVHPRKYAVRVSGETVNPYIFEIEQDQIPASALLALARPRPGATHLSIVRQLGPQRRSEYHALNEIAGVTLADGDEVTLTSDKYPGTILVRMEGAHLGERTLVMPYGSHLSDALDRLKSSAQTDLSNLQLFRRSVAARQKDRLETSLRSLETYTLTARSATSEEAVLRGREAEMISQFITRARTVQPKGQIILGSLERAKETLLEDGDVIRIPDRSNLVLISGEVLFPNALVHDPQAKLDDYVNRAGGYNQGADKARVIVLHADGRVASSEEAQQPQPGDEIMVLPRIETKSIEVTRGITQIIYQIAVAAKVLLGL